MILVRRLLLHQRRRQERSALATSIASGASIMSTTVVAPPRRQQIHARKIGRFVGGCGGSRRCITVAAGSVSPKTRLAPRIAPRSAPEASVKFLLELLVVIHVIQALLVTDTGFAGIGGAPDTAVLRWHLSVRVVVARRRRRGTRHGACCCLRIDAYCRSLLIWLMLIALLWVAR